MYYICTLFISKYIYSTRPRRELDHKMNIVVYVFSLRGEYFEPDKTGI